MDWSTIICCFITAAFSLIGVIIANNRSNAKIQGEIKTTQAVMNQEIKELTREVRQHNNFAQRMPVVENNIKHIENELKSITNRLNDLDKRVN